MNDIDIDINNSSASDSDTWSFNSFKMGDVDFNSTLSSQVSFRGQEQAESRNDRSSKMDYFVESLGRNCIKEGRTFILEIQAEDKLEMTAYQFGISFDTETLAVLDVRKSGFGNFDMENFGLKQLDKGELKTLWMSESVKNVKLNSTSRSLFKIRLKALEDICNLEEVIRLDDKVLENFLLDESGNRVKAHLVFKPHLNNLLNKETANANSLTTIYPNPTNTDLSVEFELTNTEKVWISITDQYGGRILKEETYESGSHRILIDETNNLKSGVLFYTISLGEKIYKGTVIKH